VLFNTRTQAQPVRIDGQAALTLKEARFFDAGIAEEEAVAAARRAGGTHHHPARPLDGDRHAGAGTMSPDQLLRRRLLAASALGVGLPACGSSPKVPSALDDALALPIVVDRDEDNRRGIFFGLFRESALPDLLADAEADLRRQPAAAMWFTRFGAAFPESQIRYLAQRGVAAQVTWEPWGFDNSPVALADIVAGKWDATIDAWALGAARVDLPFMLRVGHEFNGDWYPWCLVKNGRQPQLFARAHRHIVERFRAAGANKVRWVWCFNNDSTPAEAWNDPRAATTGDEYVDWIGNRRLQLRHQPELVALDALQPGLRPRGRDGPRDRAVQAHRAGRTRVLRNRRRQGRVDRAHVQRHRDAAQRPGLQPGSTSSRRPAGR
jgi:hypothetical protein